MSKQAKKREINKYRVKIAQLKNSIKLEIEIRRIAENNSSAFSRIIMKLQKEKENLEKDLEFKEALIGVYKDGNKKIDKAIEIYKEKINKLQRENEQLKAENYSLKHRGLFKRILGA